MKINWEAVGCPNQPGMYELPSGEPVNVEWKPIRQWQQHPRRLFKASFSKGTLSSGPCYVLGNYVPDDEEQGG
jgi:hypothetical protein